MSKTVKRLAAMATLGAILLTVAVSGANAGSARSPYVLRGVSITVDEAQGKSRMAGSLIGGWQTTSLAPLFQSSTQYAANGTEMFTGCHDINANKKCEAGEQGTLRFTFTYWGTFEPTTGALLKGQCVHPIIEGTGAFKGARGVIYMKDTPTATGVLTVYSGTLLYSSSPDSRATASRSLASVNHFCGA
jgi:hypothetical protein